MRNNLKVLTTNTNGPVVGRGGKGNEMSNMPVGACCVCDRELDHSDAGFCKDCGGAFCWSDCGGWGPDGHRCENCGGDEDDEEDDRAVFNMFANYPAILNE